MNVLLTTLITTELRILLITAITACVALIFYKFLPSALQYS